MLFQTIQITTIDLFYSNLPQNEMKINLSSFVFLKSSVALLTKSILLSLIYFQKFWDLKTISDVGYNIKYIVLLAYLSVCPTGISHMFMNLIYCISSWENDLSLLFENVWIL